MRSWWEVAVPHKDIREGNFNEAVFAADLGNVMLGRGPLDYTDPEVFFSKTYITRGLREFLKAALLRLAGKRDQGVVQLRTPFGGGKTHALVALYHLVKNHKQVKHLAPVRALLEEANLEELPRARVAGFVGTYADVVAGQTPWGAIAEQFGLYDLVREHDKKGVPSGIGKLLELFSQTGPVAILIDELLEYAVRARKTIGEGQVLAFLHELTEAANKTPGVFVVLTFPASLMEIYDEHAEKLFSQIQHIAGRVETIHTPVEDEEVSEVIRRRLFERTGSPKEIAEISNAYFEYYQSLGGDLPAEAREAAYREKIRRSFPFHPELIEVLYHRWGSLPTFQRTRGVLRLLALVVGDLYKRQVPAPLIHPSHVNLREPRIRAEFIKHTGSKSEYESVVAADLTGSRIESLNVELGTEYLPYRVAEGVATTIFLHSFSGAEHRRGVTLGKLKLCFLRPGFPLTLVEGVLQKLSDRLWYLHEGSGLYYFSNVPNLNLIITQQEESVREDEITEAFREKLRDLAGKEFPCYLWPEKAADVPDVKRPTIVLLSPDYPYPNGKTGEFLRELFDKTGGSFRTHKNVLFVIALDAGGYTAVRQAARKCLALKSIKSEKTLWEQLREDQQKTVEEKLTDVQGHFERKVIEAYRYLYYLGSGGEVTFSDLGIPTLGTKMVSGRVKSWLRENERLLERISPENVVKLLLGGDAERKSIREMWEDTLKYPGMPLLESEDVLLQAVQEGAQKGLFGVATSGGLVFRGTAPCQVTLDSEVLRKDVAEREARPEPEVPTGGEQEGDLKPKKPEAQVGEGTTVLQPTPATKASRQYRLRMELPLEKFSDFMKGVLVPLRSAGCRLKLVLDLTASHDEGIPKDVLELKVRETLRQLSTTVLLDEEG